MASTHPEPSSYLPSIYRTKAGKLKLQEHYDATLAALPFPVESFYVTTQFGKAHVLSAGLGPHCQRASPVLFIWQGTAAPAPFMLDLFASFIPHYHVYAVDFPCQAGSRSDPCRLSPETHDIGKWCVDVISGLNLDRLRPLLHVGISFGAGIILDLAQVEPSLISAAALIVPSSIHPGITSYRYFFDVAWRVFLPMIAFRWVPNRWTKHRIFATMFDEPDVDHPSMTQQELAFKHILWFPIPTKQVSKEDLKDYKAPTLVVAATKDVFGGGQATAARAREVFDAQHLEVEVVNSKHVPGKDIMDGIMKRVADFFAAKGFAGV